MSQPPGSPGAPQQGPGGPPQYPGGPRPSSQPPSQGWPSTNPHVPANPPTQPFPAARGPVFGPPGSDSQQPGKKPRNTKKLGLIIGASILALVLVVVGVILAVNYQTRVAEQRAAAAAAQAAEEREVELTRQESAVQASAQGFLNALTQGDPEAALSFAAASPEGNNELLSRDVLFEANKRAPLTGVSVDEPALTESAPSTWTEGTVKVRYSIGDQPQSVDLPVRKVGADWKIDKVAAPVQLGLSGPDRLVNGVTVPPGEYNLFPGSYSVTSTNPLVTLSTTEYILGSPVDSFTNWESDVVLSEEGNNQTLEASKRAVDQCLQSRELAPANCPFIQWSEDGLTIDQSTIRYTLKNDPWAGVQFQFNAGTMTATTSVTVEHEIRADATQNGRTGTLVPATQSRPAHISVKLGSGTPEVTFT
jgi:hypothetical protein